MERSIKVYIADDHDMVRMGLKTFLDIEPDIEVIGEAENGKRLVEHLENLTANEWPDVILMDLFMPEMDGVEATKRIMAKYPNVKIIMLTSFLEDEMVINAIEAGAVNYVLKTVKSNELVAAIRGAMEGTPTMSSEVSQALTRGLRQRTSQTDQEGLTSREKEVLLLIAEGKSNKEIASELHISIKTVKTHVSNLLMKCDVADRTQLAIYAHRKGWVS